ncbi:hypothetical protein FNO01nite_33080 [Flavobacterium noncentrifugens]|uniref:Uncharacterized protein n=1 Tax=Flavobacterium noncentrifugens TaxID=1128970 RepID=A0A1G8ZJG8_9FLAO|nr:hypothetical protein [Flavobacterium noncentrifugens]GEP52636.1 hypothetical protein FNO01nite_33080 [Flavobacterium noncentrifugens]SDK15197.1 hypothetical protein SAMN04487935_2626 [Flavobacterium noncentrifugens]
MENTLTKDDLDFLITSVTYSKKSFDETNYESYEFKQSQLAKADEMLQKLRRLLKDQNH